MLVEFFEDYFVKNPKEAWKIGGVVETGDPIIDRWERQIAAGEEPDLNEGLSESNIAEIESWCRRADLHDHSGFDDFNDIEYEEF